jgi:hypothetical protein
MNPSTFRAIVCVCLTAGCHSAPPAQSPSQPVAPPPAVAQAPKSEAIARADALLEDLKRREAAQAQLDKQNPPPSVIAPVSFPGVPAARSTTSTPQAASASPASGVAIAEAPPAAAPARDEMWWKNQMRSLQITLDEEVVKLAAAEKQMKDAAGLRGYDDAQAEFNRQLAAVANARLAADRLRDDARRASIPPGWLRWP